MRLPPHRSTLFPYTTLFRSLIAQFGLILQRGFPSHSADGSTRLRHSRPGWSGRPNRSEEHTSELQSHHDLVCRLLLEKKKKTKNNLQSTDLHINHKRILPQL